MKTGMVWALLLGLGSGVAWAQTDRLQALQADPVALKAAEDAGRRASLFCANCHGDNGVSKIPEVPNLAGQNGAYLLEQTHKFGNGQRRNEFMQGLIKALSEDEKIQLAVFYASQNPRPRAADPALAEKGKVYFTKLCLRCHGENARGNALIPRLAGQQVPYLISSITRYRDKTGERQDPQMSSAVSPLKNEDIAGVAAYLSSLP